MTRIMIGIAMHVAFARVVCVGNTMTVKLAWAAGVQIAVYKMMQKCGLCGVCNVIMDFLAMTASVDQSCIF